MKNSEPNYSKSKTKRILKESFMINYVLEKKCSNPHCSECQNTGI